MGQSVLIKQSNKRPNPELNSAPKAKQIKPHNKETHKNADNDCDCFLPQPLNQNKTIPNKTEEGYFENIFATAQDFMGSVNSTLDTVMNYFSFEGSEQSKQNNPPIISKPINNTTKTTKDKTEKTKPKKIDKGFEMVFAAEAPRITKFFTQITEKNTSISKQSKKEIKDTLRKIQKNPERTYELYVELMSKEDVRDMLSNLNNQELKDFMTFNQANIKAIENYVKKTGNKDKAAQYLRRMAAIFDSVISQNLIEKKNIEIKSNKKVDPSQKKKDIKESSDLIARSYCNDGICESIEKKNPEFNNQKFDKTWKTKELKQKNKKLREELSNTVKEKHTLTTEESKKVKGVVANKIEEKAKKDLFLGEILDEENKKIKTVIGKYFNKVGGHLMRIVDGDEDAKKIFLSDIVKGKVNLSKEFLLKYLTSTLYETGEISQTEYDQALFTQDYSVTEKHLSNKTIRFSPNNTSSSSKTEDNYPLEFNDTYQKSKDSTVDDKNPNLATHESNTKTTREKFMERNDIPEHIRLIAASIPGLVLNNITDMGALLAALKSIGFSAQKLLTITGDMEFVRKEVLAEVSTSGFTNNMINDLVDSVIDGKSPNQSAELVFAKLQNKIVKKVYAKNNALNNEANRFKLQRDLIKEFKNLSSTKLS